MKAGVLPLAIETGRFKNVPEILRICKMCEDGSIENEMHLIFDCDSVTEEREKMMEELKRICDIESFNGTEKLKRMLEVTVLKPPQTI